MWTWSTWTVPVSPGLKLYRPRFVSAAHARQMIGAVLQLPSRQAHNPPQQRPQIATETFAHRLSSRATSTPGGATSAAADAPAGRAQALFFDALSTDRQTTGPGPPRRTTKWAAIILLLFGGFIFGVGWLAGLILLWSSRAWTTREKWDRNARRSSLATSVLIGLIALGVPDKKLCESHRQRRRALHQRCRSERDPRGRNAKANMAATPSAERRQTVTSHGDTVTSPCV